MQQAVGDTRKPLLLILAAVGFVLFVACQRCQHAANAIARSGEGAISSRCTRGWAWSAMRKLPTESLLLAITGGAFGILIATTVIRFVKALGPSDIARLQEVTIDLRVLGFATVVTLVTGLLFGLAPAIGTQKKI